MTIIDGLPAHVLLVHLVVVLVPLSAVLLLVTALWPAARQRVSFLTALLSALALVLVPITTEAGDWLEHHLPRTPLLLVHTELGDYMLPWAIALFAVSACIATRELLAGRVEPEPDDAGPDAAPAAGGAGSTVHRFGGRPVGILLAVMAVLTAFASTAVVYKIGDSGARAAWTGKYSETPVPGPKEAATEDG